MNSKNGKNEQETTNKRKSKASIAKAAEAKRRKLEGDHNDPLADDGAGAAPVKREPGIKQERMSFSLARTPWNGSSDACQELRNRQPYTSSSALYGVPAQAAGPRIKIEEGYDAPMKCFDGVSNSSAYDGDDERIFDDFCNSELFDSSQESVPALGDTSKDAAGAIDGSKRADRGSAMEAQEHAQQCSSPLPSVMAATQGVSQGAVGATATNQTVQHTTANIHNDDAATTVRVQGGQDVVVILD